MLQHNMLVRRSKMLTNTVKTPSDQTVLCTVLNCVLCCFQGTRRLFSSRNRVMGGPASQLHLQVVSWETASGTAMDVTPEMRIRQCAAGLQSIEVGADPQPHTTRLRLFTHVHSETISPPQTFKDLHTDKILCPTPMHTLVLKTQGNIYTYVRVS
jgi:hypothetical protein